jgi:prepilin-type N-terminal cleavage/methylation domain-containing protein
MKNKTSSRGFTLIELLVVVGISAVLSGLAIVYSHVGQDQVTLSVEQAKISELILQAKELSIATYGTDANTCAYGIHFNFAAQTYSLFAYDSRGAGVFCPSPASTTADGLIAGDIAEYAQGTWNVHVSPGVVMEPLSYAGDVLSDVIFYPPDPTTLVSHDGVTFTSIPEATVYLKTTNGSAVGTVSVNPAGQVNL